MIRGYHRAKLKFKYLILWLQEYKLAPLDSNGNKGCYELINMQPQIQMQQESSRNSWKLVLMIICSHKG